MAAAVAGDAQAWRSVRTANSSLGTFAGYEPSARAATYPSTRLIVRWGDRARSLDQAHEVAVGNLTVWALQSPRQLARRLVGVRRGHTEPREQMTPGGLACGGWLH
jgi:hypothetical protein